MIATSGKHSDGEENALPILVNRMLVTETLPLPVRGNQTKTFILKKLMENKSTTLQNYNLTLEFTANPAWYAIQALPYMMEYPYECIEQVFNRFYANSIATHIANSSPKIKKIFDTWKEVDKDALLSNLEKNQELKYALLEETPWVLDAQDESERKRRVGLLFDLVKMAGELERAEKKMQEMQYSNGGWPWFPGLPENRFITQYIVVGMGHLERLGIKDIRENSVTWEMLRKAVIYTDIRMYEDYEWIKKHGILDKKNIGYIQAQYLYGRSYYLDIPVDDKYKEAFDYWKGQAQTSWLSNNKYMQGMIALALYRMYDARGRAVEACAEEGGRPHEEESGQHRGHARRGLRLAEHRERAPGQPVKEGRLLEPGLALQRWPHPLAGAVHLDRHAGVPGLVGAEERNSPEAKDEEGENEGEQDRRRAGRQAVRHQADPNSETAPGRFGEARGRGRSLPPRQVEPQHVPEHQSDRGEQISNAATYRSSGKWCSTFDVS